MTNNMREMERKSEFIGSLERNCNQAIAVANTDVAKDQVRAFKSAIRHSIDYCNFSKMDDAKLRTILNYTSRIISYVNDGSLDQTLQILQMNIEDSCRRSITGGINPDESQIDQIIATAYKNNEISKTAKIALIEARGAVIRSVIEQGRGKLYVTGELIALNKAVKNASNGAIVECCSALTAAIDERRTVLKKIFDATSREEAKFVQLENRMNDISSEIERQYTSAGNYQIDADAKALAIYEAEMVSGANAPGIGTLNHQFNDAMIQVERCNSTAALLEGKYWNLSDVHGVLKQGYTILDSDAKKTIAGYIDIKRIESDPEYVRKIIQIINEAIEKATRRIEVTRAAIPQPIMQPNPVANVDTSRAIARAQEILGQRGGFASNIHADDEVNI